MQQELATQKMLLEKKEWEIQKIILDLNSQKEEMNQKLENAKKESEALELEVKKMREVSKMETDILKEEKI